jgi:exonuclease III
MALQTSFIFLSDLRLNTDTVGFNNLFFPRYEMLHNSTSNKRGVGLLIASSLQYTITKTYKDISNNILGIRINIGDTPILVISIYGPNHNDNCFFRDLKRILDENRLLPVVCAGDWNTTYSTAPADTNIDIFSMLNPPSLIRSGWLADICDDYGLIDPYRAINHSKRDYTYIPNTGNRNRSRLDFFLISDRLLSICNMCNISQALSSEIFDHKSISMHFVAKKSLNFHFINPTIFKHPRFEAVVATASAETFLQHAVHDQVDVDIEEGLLHVGRLISKITECNEIEFSIAFEGDSDDKRLTLQNLETQLNELLYSLPDPERFNEIELTCNPDIFLETLMGNIRNSLISFQAWHKKVKNAKVSSICKNLNILRCDYTMNADEIFRLERELVVIRDIELSSIMNEMKIFDHLHNEKPSPLFLNLLKCNNKDSLQCIKGDAGEILDTQEKLEAHLVKFYSDVYSRKTQEVPVDYSDCINEFLGADIINHPVVRNSKLSDEERDELDRPFTIAELDDSLKNCNIKSAAGRDGYSNKLIRLCWNHLRIPLFKYANFCFETGMLTENFRSASIKLIPKKGNLEQLKNWRPISLLSNMYKIISRAFNIRLKKIVNRICSRAQKGYNSDRYVQEVLINVCETIAHCKTANTRGSVLAIDMAKAFDTLNHDYIKAVFRFFGFGDYIIKWLNLLGNRRQACILMDGGLSTKFFDLDTGRAQGDNLSPFIFNFCEQILIFKLELDHRIIKIPRNAPRIIHRDGVYSAESNRETASNESLADDNTVLSIIDRDSLLHIKKCLQDFSTISGLHCNFDKTALMPVFPLTAQESDWIAEAGFSVVHKIKLLGAEISVNFNDLQDNFTRIKDKITKLINFWNRFKLSMTGRITIAKTFLVSQINYLGCIFAPNDVILNEIQTLINTFIRKNLKISDERIQLSPEMGGLGFFNISQFLDAQRATWLLRARKNCIDNWRYDLHLLAPGNNVLLLRSTDINVHSNPVLFDICRAYEKFYAAFSSYSHNFKEAQIFLNIFQDPVTGTKIDQNFFGLDFFNAHMNVIRNLTYDDCFTPLGFKTIDEFRALGLPLTISLWMRLRNVLYMARAKYSVRSCQKTTTINNFVLRWRKGCRPLRNILTKVLEYDIDLRSRRSFITFSALAGIVPDLGTDLGRWYAAWNCSSFTNDFRTFIFNSRNNFLPFNNRLNAYISDVDPSCTYCRNGLNRPAPRDSMSHCFLYCPTVRELLQHFILLLGLQEDIDTTSFKVLYWYGSNDLNLWKKIALLFVFDSFRYMFFKNRLRRISIDVENFFNDLYQHIFWTCKANRNINLSINRTFIGTRFLQALG